MACFMNLALDRRDTVMSLSSDASPLKAGSNVLKFPGSTPAGRTRWLGLWRSARLRLRSSLKRHWFTVTVIALATAGIGAALWSFAAASLPRYVTVSAARGTIARTVAATGTVNPAQTIVVGASISGTVQNLACDYDSEVKAGQVCAKIDPRPYQALLDQYNGQLLRDQAILEKDRADFARLRRQMAVNPLMRRQVTDQALIVSRDEGTVKLDRALVDSAKLNLGYTDIVAPADGTVLSRNVSQGQPVVANAAALFTIATDSKRMEVDVASRHSNVGAVRRGNAVTMTVEGIPDRIFHGAVSQVRRSAPSAQGGAATYDAVISIDNADLVLKPGMTAVTRIVVDQKNDVLRVPDQALQFAPANAKQQSASQSVSGSAEAASPKNQVWVMRGNVPVAVAVVTGLDDGGFTEIAAGDLRPGDQVIVGENRPLSGSQQGAP
jgi:HlyD family secretion protein